MDGMLQALGLKEDEAIIHPWINKALEKAQAKVEARNFDIRKNLLKFDNVMNDQRKAIFEQRLDLMNDADLGDTVGDMRRQVIDDLMAKHVPEKAFAEQWDVDGLKEDMQATFDLDLPVADWAKEEGIGEEEVHERLVRAADEKAAKKAADFGPHHHAPDREGGAAADARSSVARASRHARASPPGDRLARLRPARPAERI